ncbi:DNA polymerase III subunit delta [bacterium]|nr:DNA polymerase III subunit delta [bacterium]
MKLDNFAQIRVILLSGEEFQRSERLSEILEATVDPATRDFNLDTVYPDQFTNNRSDPGKITVEGLSALIQTFPMMAERRVVVVRDFDQLHKEIQKKACEIIKNTPETTLVIVEGEKASLSPKPPKDFFLGESFKRIYENQLPSWIRQRFTRRGRKVTDDAIALIVNNVGDGLRELDGEIEKITIAAGESVMINGGAVELVVGELKRHTVYTLSNAVGLGDFSETLRILTSLMETEKNRETFYLGALMSHIMKIALFNGLVRSGAPTNEAMKTVTDSPFLWKLNKMDAQARNFGQREVRRALSVLGRTESLLKKSGIDNRLLMELMIPFVMPKAEKTIIT